MFENVNQSPQEPADILAAVDKPVAPQAPASMNAGVPPLVPPRAPSGVGKVIAIVAGVILIVGLGGALAYVVMKNTSEIKTSDTTPTTSEVTGGEVSNEMPTQEEPTTPEAVVEQPAETAPTPNIDTDGDGIPTAEEIRIGTNPDALDSDGDGLFDNEEINIYFTNPINPDSDGDSYPDGTEIQNGYDPNGPGRLFQNNTQQ